MFSQLENLPQMCLDEEPGGVDLGEEHVEGEFIDYIVVFEGRASVYI